MGKLSESEFFALDYLREQKSTLLEAVESSTTRDGFATAQGNLDDWLYENETELKRLEALEKCAS